MLDIYKKNKKRICLVLFLLVIFYPFLGIWQWGDFTDLGWICMEIQNFNQRLAVGRMESPRLLTFFLGSAWWHSFPSLGVFGLLALACALIVVAAFGATFAFKNLYVDINPVLLATLAAQAFYVRNALQFDYDLVSLVFALWSAALVVRSLGGGRLDWMFFAGILAALAAASRTPSVVLLGLGALPFFNMLQDIQTPEGGGSSAEPMTRILKAVCQAVMFFAGFAACMLVFFGILRVGGLWHAYLEGFAPYLANNSAEGSSGAYDMVKVVQGYVKEAQLLFPFALLALSWGVVTAILFRPGAFRFMQISFSLVSLAAICLWVVKGSMQGYGHPLKFLVPGFYFVVAFIFLINILPCKHNVRIAIAAGCLLCISSFAGSNTGFLKMSGGMMFLVPACTVALVSAGSSFGAQKRVWGWQGVGVLAAIVLLAGSFSARATQVYHAANDWSCRYRFVHTIQNVPLLAGLRTSKDRADYLATVIPELVARIGDDPVYVYGHTPMIYSLLQKDSFIPEIWFANDAYSVDFILNSLREKMTSTVQRPAIIVTEKTSLGYGSWERMAQFLDENLYRRVYSFDEKFRPYDAELWLAH